MPAYVFAHSRRIAHQLGTIARHPENALNHRRDLLTQGWRAEYRTRTAQRHMLPGPRFLALVALERLKRDDQHALGPFRAKPRINLVERTGCGGDAERSGNSAGEAIEIVVGTERPLAVGNAAPGGTMQVDDVEVRRVGE